MSKSKWGIIGIVFGALLSIGFLFFSNYDGGRLLPQVIIDYLDGHFSRDQPKRDETQVIRILEEHTGGNLDADQSRVNRGILEIMHRYLNEPFNEIARRLIERRFLTNEDIDQLDSIIDASIKRREIADRLIERKYLNNEDIEQLRSLQTYPPGDYVEIVVFYATDRNRTSEAEPTKMFGNDRYRPSEAEPTNDRGPLSFGYCVVTIPHDHRMGELESPWFKIKSLEDPAKYVVLLNTVIKSKDEFFKDLAARVHDSAKSSAFLFVHGYNVTFEDAARRTAQIAYDLKFEGVPIFYSWPSKGTTLEYIKDETNIEWSEPHLKNFLEDFFERSDAQNVYLIAHSMGSQALTKAVKSILTDKPIIRSRLKEVILAAPDIDAEVFKRDLVPALTQTNSPATLYASSKDLALAASKKVHGYPRAGDSGQGLVVVPGIETIDATHVDTGLFGHSYYAEASSILSDIFSLINDGQRADQRFGLRRVDAQVGRYWEFRQ